MIKLSNIYTVLDLNMDYCNYKHVNNSLARDRVEDMILNLDLTDIWRDLIEECRRFTWQRPTLLQQSCLDFFLISESMVPYVEQTDIYIYILSSMDTGQTILWLFWNFYLQKKKWNEKHSGNFIIPCWKIMRMYNVKEINEEIKNVIEEYAIMLYDRK